MNQFKMSLFLPPISPVKDSTTGRIIQPPTLTPYKEITLQEVYKLITSSERLKTLTETVRRAVENGDEKVYRMLKQQTLPYVTPCGVFSYRKSDSLTGPSGLIVVDIDHLDSRREAEKLKRQLFDDLLLRPVLAFTSPSGHGVKAFIPAVFPPRPIQPPQYGPCALWPPLRPLSSNSSIRKINLCLNCRIAS